MRRQKRHGTNLVEVITSLLTCPEPVTFYDAFALARQLRGQDEPSSRIVAALIQLHDADHSTDGARTVLADLLRGLANRQETQRLIAQRPFTLKDDTKTARAPAGARLELHLEERRAVGFRWEVAQRDGPATVKRDPKSAETQSTAFFAVHLQRAGLLDLTLEERRPVADDYYEGEESENRQFRLTVIIESRSG